MAGKRKLARHALHTVLLLGTSVVIACGGGGGGGGGSTGMLVYVVAGDAATQTLFRFNTDSPRTIETIGPVGLGGSGLIWAIAFRPQDGLLFAFAYTCGPQPPPWGIALYRIDITTGAATLVAASATPNSCQEMSGFSVDPLGVGRVTGESEHWAVDLDSGTFSSRTGIAYIAGDPNQIALAVPAHLAYDGAGQAYVIDPNTRALGRLADLSNPDPGRLSTVGSLVPGISGATLQSGGGFDIRAGRALAILRTTSTGLDRLYDVDLATGVVADLGLVGDGLLEVDAMAIQP